MSSASSRRIVIVGAGSAGLLAAIAAARAGADVSLIERQAQPGRRLLATGGGRCNVTNTCDRSAFLKAFGRQGRFLGPALDVFDGDGLRELLASLDMATQEEAGGRVFPVGQRAGDVLRALLNECKRLGVTIETGVGITGLWIEEGTLQGLRIGQEMRPAECVIITAGGCAWPELGGNRSGLDLARQAGHEIVPPTPALVGLVVRQAWAGELAGISLCGASVTLLERRHRRTVAGDVLFTARGLSGPAVLDLSGDVAALLAKQEQVAVTLSLPAPDQAAATWETLLAEARQAAGRKRVRSLLAAHMPDRLAGVLCAQAGVPEGCTAAMLPVAAQRELLRWLGAIPLTVTGTEGFAKAMVMRGGVKLRGVAPATMASRHLEGLYLAGEVLDLDGPSGGYNLQAAFSTGYLAGVSAAAGSTQGRIFTGS